MSPKWLEQVRPLLKERKIAIAGGIVGLLLVYLVIWLPFANSITSLRKEVASEKSLLAWMQPAKIEIVKLRKQAIPSSSAKAQPILTVVDESLKSHQLASLATNLKQVNEEVQMDFQSVSFDVLIKWIEDLWKNDHILVQRITVDAKNAPGMVEANLTLKAAG